MKCAVCGYENSEGSQFCGQCGEVIAEENDGLPPVDSPMLDEVDDSAADDIFTGLPTTDDQLTDDMDEKPGPSFGSDAGFSGSASFRPTADDDMPVFAANPEKKPPTKKILAISIPVITLALLAIALTLLIKSPHYIAQKHGIQVVQGADFAAVSVDTSAVINIDGALSGYLISMDGAKAALLMDVAEAGGGLWYVTSAGKTKVADDVVGYVLAQDGNGLAYLTDYNADNETAVLYLYDCSAKKTVKVADEALFFGDYSPYGVCLSPDGKTVTYLSDYNEETEQFACYIKNGGKAAEKLGNSLVCVAVSNNAKYLYYIKQSGMEDTALYVRTGQDDVKLIPDCAGIDLSADTYLNSDYSQLMFNYDDKSYISVKGREKERLSGVAVSGVVLPPYTQRLVSWAYYPSVCGVSSFADLAVYTSDSNMMYIDRQFSAVKITSSYVYNASAVAAPDAKNLLFIDNSNRLSQVDATDNNATKNILAEDVSAFTVSDSGKLVYYINRDGELWCKKGSGKAVKISDDVSASHLVMTGDSNTAFFLVDYRSGSGTLYYSNNGGKRSKVTVEGADDVKVVLSTAVSVFYESDFGGGSDIYRSGGNGKFSKITSVESKK